MLEKLSLRSYHFGFHVRDLTDKSVNSKIEMKRKSRLPRQETVEELQELLKRAHNKEEWENIQALYGFQSVQIKTIKGIAFAWSQGGATSIDGGTTLPPEDEILYEILPRLNQEEKDIFGKKLLRSELKN